jgi:carbon monoxide dehydrogenase subunit G
VTFRTLVLAGWCCSAALADFSYEQSSKITGGAMAGMMRAAGALSKAAREPQKVTVMVKGDRMATVMPTRVSVIDLRAETITDIDMEKQTYSTITFAQMAESMRKLAERVGQQGGMQFKAEVTPTGRSRVIQGLAAKETLVRIAVESADPKAQGRGMNDITMELWLAPDMLAYAEVRAFHQRMAQKLAWTPGSLAGPMAAQNQGGMAELAKEMAKLDGIPVLQITRIGSSGGGATAEAAPPRTEEEGRPAGGSVLGGMGKVGGLAGGFGGFGRRKKTEPREQPAEPTAAAAPGPLMEMTTEMTAFSQAVDASKFEVPTGYKQVPHEMLRDSR